MSNTAQSWSSVLKKEKEKAYFKQLLNFVAEQRQLEKLIYPDENLVFEALNRTEFNQVKVVILGQDPYHGPDQANGLAFSVNSGTRLPPSLRNIFKELTNDLNTQPPVDGDLSFWADQGVLLLNTVLTVENGKAHSHQGMGWETFTDHIIERLNIAEQHIVFLLWGSHAQKKSKLITNKVHTQLKAPHPSPLSAHRGFLGCQHFSKTNQALLAHNQSPIQWFK